MREPPRNGILPSTPITMARGLREPPAATSYKVRNREPCPAWDKTEITNDPLYMGITEILRKYGIMNPERQDRIIAHAEAITSNTLGGGKYQLHEQYGETMLDNILGLASAYASIRPHNQAIGLSMPMKHAETQLGKNQNSNEGHWSRNQQRMSLSSEE
jgi:hypothetical protein